MQALTSRPGVWLGEDWKYHLPESHPNFDPTRLAVEQVSTESDFEIASTALLLSTWLAEALNEDARLAEAFPDNGATAPLLVLSCSTLGTKALTHGSGQSLFVWKRTLIQERIGQPWSTEELAQSAEHRAYLNFFSRLCLLKLVMPDEAERMAIRLWQLLNERSMQGPLWRLPPGSSRRERSHRPGRVDRHRVRKSFGTGGRAAVERYRPIEGRAARDAGLRPRRVASFHSWLFHLGLPWRLRSAA
jgi:hypothetical protein